MKHLVCLLAKACGIVEWSAVLKIAADSPVEKANGLTPGSVRFVWICDLEDPVRMFWLLKKLDLMADQCHVVFSGITDSPSWVDLTRLYGGLRFGNIFLVVYRANFNPGTVPSMKGLFQ